MKLLMLLTCVVVIMLMMLQDGEAVDVFDLCGWDGSCCTEGWPGNNSKQTLKMLKKNLTLFKFDDDEINPTLNLENTYFSQHNPNYMTRIQIAFHNSHIYNTPIQKDN